MKAIDHILIAVAGTLLVVGATGSVGYLLLKPAMRESPHPDDRDA